MSRKRISANFGSLSRSSKDGSGRGGGGELNWSNLVDDEADEEKRLQLLECPVCFEISLPPIYQCQTGHNICHNCVKVLSECPTCNSKTMKTRNFALESIVKSVRFDCKHRNKGCDETGNCDTMQGHHSICKFRPVECHLRYLFEDCHNCEAGSLYFTDYAMHLNNVHHIPFIEPDDDRKSNVFTRVYSSPADDGGRGPVDATWPVTLYNFDGEVFTVVTSSRGPLIFVGIFLVGDKSVAAKYGAKISVRNPYVMSSKYEARISPLHSIRDLEVDLQEVEGSLPHSVSIIHNTLVVESLCYPVKFGDTQELSFAYAVRYEIIKL